MHDLTKALLLFQVERQVFLSIVKNEKMEVQSGYTT